MHVNIKLFSEINCSKYRYLNSPNLLKTAEVLGNKSGKFYVYTNQKSFKICECRAMLCPNNVFSGFFSFLGVLRKDVLLTNLAILSVSYMDFERINAASNRALFYKSQIRNVYKRSAGTPEQRQPQREAAAARGSK